MKKTQGDGGIMVEMTIVRPGKPVSFAKKAYKTLGLLLIVIALFGALFGKVDAKSALLLFGFGITDLIIALDK